MARRRVGHSSGILEAEVSGQLHHPAALDGWVDLGLLWMLRRQEDISCLCLESNADLVVCGPSLAYL
jgi:hypothetical protein